MTIALLGYGTVGSGVYEILGKRQAQTDALTITHVLNKPEHPRQLAAETFNYQVILDDPEVTTVVEAIGGLEPAHTYIAQALAAGKNVVTSNKAVMAKFLVEFGKLAQANHVQIRFEAAVGGGIPWLCNLQQAMLVDEITALGGIFNGTSNYILSQMQTAGCSFEEALHQAQAKGYAEKDPTADVDGLDVQNKLRLSAAIAFGIDPGFDLPTLGIAQVQAKDLAYCQKRGQTIKLLGQAVQQNGQMAAAIMPTVLPLASLTAQTADSNNLLALTGANAGTLQFYGQGAGKLPTASAVVQDILAIDRGQKQTLPGFTNTLPVNAGLLKCSYLLRVNGQYETRQDLTAPAALALLHQVQQADPQALLARIQEA